MGFIGDWLDGEHDGQAGGDRGDPRNAPPGRVIVLENARKYDVERLLWKAKAADVPKLADRLARFANEMAQKIAKVYVHEAFSAGSLDASSVVVPAAMDQVALGLYEAQQFDVQLRDCFAAQMVVFSGLKADKLDDMEAMINRGKIRLVIRPDRWRWGWRRGPPSWTARTSTSAWPRTRPRRTSRSTSPATASSRPRR